MLIGYARVSRTDQNLAGQLDMLTSAGVDPKHIYVDKMSGAKDQRPGFDAMLSFARPGDTIVVTRIDRVGRSIAHLVRLMVDLDERDIGLRFLTLDIDTRTPYGRFLVQIMGAFAEMERALLIERTREGLEAARARGVRFGPPPKLSPDLIRLAEAALATGATVTEVARTLDVARTTLYRNLPSLKNKT